MSSNVTGTYSTSKLGLLQEYLVSRGFSIAADPGTVWRAKNSGSVVTLYSSGKVLLQGPEADVIGQALAREGYVTFATTIKKPEGTGTSLTNLLFPRIGSDESGKGDYFGPLVTAAVFLDVKTQDYLLRIGVKDSKALSDQVIEGLARKIKQETLSSVISIGPERYNDLYPKMRSVNRLLGWTHARAIENLLEQLDAVYQMGERPEIVAIADQFGDESFIKRALMEKGRSIELRQMPKAEADLAVAAASILARDEFVRRLDWLGKDVGMNLPKGASEKVVEAGRVIVSRFGSQKLALVAKLHFKTTDQVRAFR